MYCASLPLPNEAPEAFRMLPEYFIEDVIEFYLFLVRCDIFPSNLATSNLNAL
jgi:ubiquitin conjugation factor E4 B